ncbi:MAG: Ig-like domain-containing protein [Ardenticatenia bacterium]|nr:Ig-like domain-containing protein [Ardenticatenia bacterium]
MRSRHLLASILVVTIALLPLAACGKKPTARPPAAAGDAGITAASRPALPARGAGLAAMPVFAADGTPLKVVQTQPNDGAEGVAVDKDDARIVVQFNHPVVPLTAVEDQEGLPDPARIEPELAGEGSWLNSATWIFTPKEDLLPAARYTVDVAAGLSDVLGGSLPQAVSFGFSTAAPVVAGTYPEDGMVDAGPREPLTVTFSTLMDHGSAEGSFSLRPAEGGGEPVAGSFRWAGRDMVFRPKAPLDRGREYLAQVAAGARAATGAAATAAAGDWRFSVAPLPTLAGSSPKNGDEASTWFRDRNAMELRFNTPMDTKGVTVTLQPTISQQTQYWDDGDRTVRIDGGWLASQAYTVTVKASSRSRWGDAMGGDAVLGFSVAAIAPTVYLKTTGPFSVYNAFTPQVAYLDVVNSPEVDLRLSRVSADELAALTISEQRWDRRERFTPADVDRLRSWTIDAQSPLNSFRRVSTTLGTAPGGLLEPGLYDLRLERLKDAQSTLLLVSNSNLTLKRAPGEVVVWATDLRSGKPLRDMPITVRGLPAGDGGQTDGDAARAPVDLAAGRTDADGVFRSALSAAVDPWAPILAISEVDGRVVAAASSDWSEGIDPYSFNFGYDPTVRPYVASAYTDRPVYRAGQTVFFRGVLRADDDAVYRLPALKTVHATVRDPERETVLETDLPVSAYGTVNGQLDLAPAARLGGYEIELAVAGNQVGASPPEENRESVATASFRVAAYRKPEYQVDVATDKPDYRQGETVRAEASASYYFGGPVAGAAATWRLIRDDYFFSPQGLEGWWDFIDYDLVEERFNDAQGEVASSGEGKTDAEGHFAFQLPADVSEQPLSQVFTVEAEITDPSHQVVAVRSSAVVHKSGLYLGLQPQEYIGKAGEPLGFNVIALDPDSHPVAGGKVDLAFYQRTWYSVQEKREDGEFYWTSHYTDTLVTKSQVTADAEGRATASFTPKTGGVHRLVATAKDKNGNAARSATYAWISGGSGTINWRQENNDRIALVADKKEYAPGETAEILIPAPFAGAEALVTVERGSIRDVRRVTLAGNSETIRVPIRSDYVPNVYVSVVLVKGVGSDSPLPQLRLGYTNLMVSTGEKQLDIQVRPDKPDYAPREKVRYAIEVKDHAGKPAQAELSLALVDKALLALADDSATPLIDAFYGQRMLGIATSASLTESADRRNQQLPAEKKGGGGGLTESGTVRRLFRDTAYWNAAVVTGLDGKAQVTVDLPDNLTTWSLSARGVTGASTIVGAAQNEITSTLDVLVRPVLPRFLVVGDTVQLETVVNNRTDKDVHLKVAATAKGLKLASIEPQALTVPAGGAAKVVWQASVPREGLLAVTSPEALGALSAAPDALGVATVRMAAEGDGYSDAAELTLPVYAFSAAQVVATAGRLAADQSEVTEQIKLPADADAHQSELTVDLSPSLAAAVVGSLTWLKGYPYDCSEQTTSKFLPNVATYLALKRLDLGGTRLDEVRAGLESALPLQLQRLYTLQNADGGWGWWSGDSRPWLTAYALHGLQLAREAGFAVRPDALERAAAFLLNDLDRPLALGSPSDPNERAYTLWVLAQADSVPVSRVLTLYDRRSQMSHFGRAFLALALDRAGGPEQAERVRGLVADLGGAAQVSATGASWTDDRPDRWSMSSDTRTTAIAILALSQLDPGNVNLPGAIRWLMAERQEGHWNTTQETAWAVLGLTEAMDATGELKADYRYTVTLNQSEIGQGSVTSQSLDQSVTLRAPAADLKSGQTNPLTIRREGEGLVYYDAHLRLYRPADKAEPLARGIVIGRQYLLADPGTLKPSGEAVDSFKIGDVAQVKLTVICDERRDYVAVEDPIPAGFEIIDSSLKTASAAAQGAQMEEVREDGKDPSDLPWWERSWWSWWVDSQLLDHKAVFFATELPAGVYELTYMIRAQLAGNFLVAPARAEEMYFPEVFGRSAGGMVTVAGE